MQLSHSFEEKSCQLLCAKIFSADAWQTSKAPFLYRKLKIVRLSDSHEQLKAIGRRIYVFRLWSWSFSSLAFLCVLLRFELRQSKAYWAWNWREGFLNYVTLHLKSEKISTGIFWEIVNWENPKLFHLWQKILSFLRSFAARLCMKLSHLRRSFSKASIIN